MQANQARDPPFGMLDIALGMQRESLKRWGARIALGLLALVMVALICGASYEALSRHRFASHSTAPGRLVSIGDRALYIDCRGTGSPTVVFESGLGSAGALDWSLVHDEVVRTTRACSYSRAGIHASDPGVGERDANAVADDLHALLDRAGERSPFVLVAHSLGGPYAVTYTRKFGADVAGLVLVDTLHPDSIKRMEAAGIHMPNLVRPIQIASALRWTGLPRLLYPAGEQTDYELASLAGMRSELEALDQTLAEADALRQFGSRPVYVLSAGKNEDEFLDQTGFTAEQATRFLAIKRELNEEQASWSSHSQHEVVADSAHQIQWFQPERVVHAARWVIDAVRAGTPSR
jgi:pimeloyl-ACP methyl ester carboxylesterase